MSIKISITQNGKTVGKPKDIKDQGKTGWDVADYKGGKAAAAGLTNGVKDKSQLKVTVDDGTSKKTYSYDEFQKLAGSSPKGTDLQKGSTVALFLGVGVAGQFQLTGSETKAIGPEVRVGPEFELDSKLRIIPSVRLRYMPVIAGGQQNIARSPEYIGQNVDSSQIGTGSAGNVIDGVEQNSINGIFQAGLGAQVTHRIGDSRFHLGGDAEANLSVMPRSKKTHVNLAGGKTYTQEHSGNDGCVVNCGAPTPDLSNPVLFPDSVNVNGHGSTKMGLGLQLLGTGVMDFTPDGSFRGGVGAGVAGITGQGFGPAGNIMFSYTPAATKRIISQPEGIGTLKPLTVAFAGKNVTISGAPAGGWPKGTFVTRDGERIEAKIHGSDPIVIDTTGWKPGRYLVEVHAPGYKDPYAKVWITIPEAKKVDSSGKGLAGRWTIMSETVTEGAREVKTDKLVPNRDIKKGTPIRLFINGDEEVTTFYLNGTVVKDGKLPMDVKKGGKIYFAVDHAAIKDAVDPETKNTMHIEFAGDKWAHKISTEPDSIGGIDVQPAASGGTSPTGIVIKPQKGKLPKGTVITFAQFKNDWKGQPTKSRGPEKSVTLDKAMDQYEICFGGKSQTCGDIKTNKGGWSADGSSVKSDTIVITVKTKNETFTYTWNPGKKRTWSGKATTKKGPPVARRR